MTNREEITDVAKISGADGYHFIFDFKTNEFKLKMNDLEVWQGTDLSVPNTFSLVSHGDPDNGIHYLQGIVKTDKLEVLGTATVGGNAISVNSSKQSFQTNEDITHTFNTGIQLDVDYFDIKMRIVGGSNDSWIIVNCYKNGNAFSAKVGKVIGYEFDIYFSYNSSLSASNSSHTINMIGYGTNQQLDVSCFNKLNFGDL